MKPTWSFVFSARTLGLRAVMVASAMALPHYGTGSAWAQSGIVPQTVAQRNGLVRSWVGHVQMDKTRYQVTGMTLSLVQNPANAAEQRDLLLLQTNHGFLHALDAETGRTVWMQQVGDRDFLNLAPSASDKVVVVLNGQMMYALDRRNGHTLWEKRLLRVPSQKPAIDGNMVHVPHFSGHLTSYDLPQAVAEVKTEEKPKYKEERVYRSFGSIDVPPQFTKQSLAWATSRGFVFIASPDVTDVKFRFEANRPISAPLAYWTPLVLAASRDGYLYAIDELTGQARWEFSTGQSIGQRPAVVDGAVYVVPEVGGMHCLGIESGLERWFVPRITQFVAASKERLYALDKQQRMVILDAASGGQLGMLPVDPTSIKMMNTQNDRIYIISPGGVVQCLHEIGAAQPYVHKVPEPVVKVKDEKKAKKPKKEVEEEEGEVMEGDFEAEEGEEADPDGVVSEDEEEGMADEEMSEDEMTDEDDDGDPLN